MISLITLRGLLDGDLSPDAISAFVRHTERPFSVLQEARDEVADRWQGPLVSPLSVGEVRPLVTRGWHDGMEASLNLIWANLIHAHSVAVSDPLEPITGAEESVRGRTVALEALHFLAVLAPLVDAGVVVLVPRDKLPRVALDFRALKDRLEGGRAQIYAVLRADDEGELHVEPRVHRYTSDLELVASAGWSFQLPPFDSKGPLGTYALRTLRKFGRRQLWRSYLRKATLRPSEWRVLDALTRVPVPDLSDLSITNVKLIRDESAFDSWRRELSEVVVETEDATSRSRDASAMAAERLAAGAREIERTIVKSPALSAMRSGFSTLAVAGSAVLAAFPLLSVEGRSDALSLAIGSSLVDAGRRLVFYERRRGTTALESARSEHYRAAAKVFAAHAAHAGGHRAA